MTWRVTAEYDYRDESGILLYQVCRVEPGPDGQPKTFRQRRPLGKGGWAWSLEFGDYRQVRPGEWKLLQPGEATAAGDLRCQRRIPTVLYRLPELLAAPADTWVWVTEGEKDAESLRALGLVATTNPGGAGKWRVQYAEALRGRRVVLLPDNDDVGKKHMEQVANTLAGVAASAVTLELPGLPPKGDVTDWLDLDHTPAELLALLDEVQRSEHRRRLHRAGIREPGEYAPFPLDALPPVVRHFVAEGAAARRVDPAFVALPALATLASCIGNTRTIMLARDWEEPAVVWSAVVGESGTLKTPSILLPVRHLFRLQRQYLIDFRREHADWEDAQEQRHRQRRSGVPQTSAAGEKPAYRKIVCSDITLEKLGPVLEDNPRGTLVWCDELSAWFSSFSRYRESGTDLPRWLEFFRAGTSIIDRKTGDRPSLFIPRAAVSVTGGIVPAILSHSLTPEFMEAGLGARLLLAWPPPPVKKWSEQEIHPETNAAWEQLLDSLMALPFDQESDGTLRPFPLKLTPEAKGAWIQFYDAWGIDQTAAVGDWRATLAKLEAYAARFALLHHVASTSADGDPSDPVGVDSMECGICLTRWFAAEMRRIYTQFNETEDERSARRLFETIRARGGRITVRQLTHSTTLYRSSAEAESALEALAQKQLGGWQDVPTTSKGGRPTRMFVLSLT